MTFTASHSWREPTIIHSGYHAAPREALRCEPIAQARNDGGRVKRGSQVHLHAGGGRFHLRATLAVWIKLPEAPVRAMLKRWREPVLASMPDANPNYEVGKAIRDCGAWS